MAVTLPSELEGDPPVSAPDSQDFWKRYFHFYDTLNAAQPYTTMIDRLVDGIEAQNGDRVLDAGTGTGNVAAQLAARGAAVVGIDFCEHGLEKCRAKVPEGDFHLADLTHPLPFGDEQFDKVTCSLVLQYLSVPQAEAAVAEMGRVLRPGGALGLTVFAKGFDSIAVYRDSLRQHRRNHSLAQTFVFALRHLFNTLRILYYVREINNHEKRGDYTYYDTAGVEALLRRAGLEVVDVSPVFSAQCLIGIGRKAKGSTP